MDLHPSYSIHLGYRVPEKELLSVPRQDEWSSLIEDQLYVERDHGGIVRRKVPCQICRTEICYAMLLSHAGVK